MLKPISICLLSMFLLASCGYRWGSEKRRLPGGYSKIAVPVFINKTKSVGAENYFTNALIEMLNRSVNASVVKRENAELVGEGTIEKIDFIRGADLLTESKPTLPKGAVLSATYRMTVSVRIKVRRRSDQQILWEDVIASEATYQAPQVGAPGINSVNPLYNHSAQQLNLEQLADSMMNAAYQRMTETF